MFKNSMDANNDTVNNKVERVQEYLIRGREWFGSPFLGRSDRLERFLRNRQLFWHAMQAFLTMPKPVSS